MDDEPKLRARPKAQNSLAAQEMDKAEKQLDTFTDQVNQMTLDRMNQAPKLETEPQTKLSQNEIARAKDIYLKPIRSIAGAKEVFNENYRASWEFDKEYVHFTAENKEVIGETINLWTKPYRGIPAEEWKIPVNKPVWGPRYLAERIKKCSYHRIRMEESKGVIGSDGFATYMGQMAVDHTIQRLDAMPVSSRKSIFLGASGF